MNPSRRYDKGGMAGEGIWAEKIKAGGGGARGHHKVDSQQGPRTVFQEPFFLFS